jgi:hypothetical protein
MQRHLDLEVGQLPEQMFRPVVVAFGNLQFESPHSPTLSHGFLGESGGPYRTFIVKFSRRSWNPWRIWSWPKREITMLLQRCEIVGIPTIFLKNPSVISCFQLLNLGTVDVLGRGVGLGHPRLDKSPSLSREMP